ncbi:uncharacterized protein LOC121248937 isoform X2 [Juglans microcarpa x Juglans regia]|uniref:uncharacterized protein LOC121248937 isoform X2 n=1 Tax=Juglans microcarpa x Juglans regia TaxID=2249226 RepID=UPI001B7F2662|nr:uncharacterized protein LOC121248937 isoform X2 [Juglans microcarpa x Juglans regia]
MESSKRTPSVIARLMGLDELQPQQPVQKQQRVLSEYYLQRVASIGVREKRPSHEHASFRMSIEERKELSYIFRVLETLSRHKQHNPPVKEGKGSSSSSEEKLAFIRQDFLDAKCLSVDKKLQNRTEVQDATKTTYFKKDPFPKYRQEPDSSFGKFFHDRQGVPLDKCRKLGREAVQGNVKLLHKSDNGQNSHAEIDINDICKISRSQLESNSEACHPPTKIVIWKPNHGKAENDARCFSSYCSCEGLPLGDRRLKELRNTENGKLDIKVSEGKNLAYGLESTRQCPVDSKEDATKQTRHGLIWISPKVSRSELRVDGTSSKDSELMMPSNLSDRKNRYKFLFSFSHGSYVSRGAKKQILEQWKLNKTFQKDGLVGRASTLRGLLATANGEIGTRNVHHKPSKYGLSNQTAPNDVQVNSGVLLGVVNRYGLKDGSVRNFPMITSPPASSSASLQSDRYLSLERSINWAQHKSRNQNLNQKDGLGYNNMFSYKKSHPFPCSDLEVKRIAEDMLVVVDEVKGQLDKDLSNQDFMGSQLSSSVSYSDMGNSCIVQDTWVVKGEMKHKLHNSNMSAQNILQLPQPLVCSAASVSVVTDVVTAAEGKVASGAGRPCGYSKEEQFESIPCILDTNSDSSSHTLDTSIQQVMSVGFHEEGSVFSQCSHTEPESRLSLVDAYYPSPVSVLEPACIEDLSCSLECLETVNTDDIYEIQAEGSGMIVSSDEDSGEGSVNDPEENEGLMRLFRVEESRNFSYLTDVLTEAGFHDGILDMDFSTWHSPEYPMNLSVFETLEKQLGEQASWKRPERRLLFDRINSGLMEILRPCMGVPKWAKPISKRFKPRLSQDIIEEELWMLLISQEKEASKDSTVKVLQKELNSLDLGDDIDVIGSEIERLLIDELATEVISMDTF